MKVRHLLMAVCLSAVLLAGGARGDQSPLDQGAADSVLMRITQSPNASTGQNLLTAEAYFLNDVQLWNLTAMGFKWVNTNVIMDSARLSPEGWASFDYGPILYRNNKIDSTNKYDVFQLTLTRANGTGWATRTTPGLVCTYYMHVTSWTELDEVVFDTVKVLGAINTVVDEVNHEYRPTWNGPIHVYDPNRPQLSNVILSPGTLHFDAIQGQPNPAAQTVQLSSDNLALAFSLVENVSWLLKTLSSGVTPANISVSVNTVGLTAGLYEDSIRVDAPNAENTPQFIHVVLELQPPLPEIVVNRSEFFFNAIAGGTNPSPQTLSISNAGSSTLHWTVTDNQPWLSVAPGSGTGPGDVTLTVDIAGLTLGTYHGIVTITDPAAVNSPFEVPVTLSIASDLPVLVIDSQHNRWAVNLSTEMPLFTRSFGVRNGGAGSLSYWVESTSPHILYFTPASGSAPDSVTAVILYDEHPFPPQPVESYETYDTVYVYSNEAVNSPVQVLFHFRFTWFPAEISLSTGSLDLEVYECQQGYGVDLPTYQFDVTNAGDDDPMNPILKFDSSLMKIQGNRVMAPITYTVTPKREDLPVGTYYDTIMVTAKWAINKPQFIPVQYTVRPPDHAPEIVTGPAILDIAWQEDSGPLVVSDFEIGNSYGGCMSWQITEGIDWLTAETTSGQVPGTTSFLVNPSGYTMGSYSAYLEVSAPGASNSPASVPTHLLVWKLHGDWNWNGRVTMQDIAEMTNYIFGIGNQAQPDLEVGDCTCDGNITAADVVAAIDYLFISLEPICGNPY